ncbi:POM121-like protein 12 [Dasypus novemcinctus]|uniref:POM121-like protein 12 n=1 Tax=Dasypus novemcinctus TaxID=9361 RepID=UPI000329313E
MGSYLGSYLDTPKPAPPTPTPQHRAPPPKPASPQAAPSERPVLHIHRQRLGRTRPLPQIPPEWEHVNLRRVLVPEAWRRFPNKLPPQTISEPDLTCAWDAYMKRRLWNARKLRRVWSPVTIKTAPPESRGSRFAMCPPPEKPPDPCARETVLRALSQCNKGKRKFDEPLWFESPDDKRRRHSPEARPSAFKPVLRRGVAPPFVPRPGPLRRRPRARRETVCQEKAVPRPAVQPSLAASQPAAGTAPARVPNPPLERRMLKPDAIKVPPRYLSG